ncbi:hypothetical protein [Capsulimonas corticalis]|uniref:hypothetical protein n=1 Tax=Capsulimonas corticalis TaxID=2219043 RepID=UPI000F64DFC3|nr:hypothetical protein [Capsulimonas corticalis]
MTLTDIKNNDAEFFDRVRNAPVFISTVNRLGLQVDIGISQHNAVFQIWKPSWVLQRPPGHDRTLRIHFEAKDRREMRVEVGPEPWIASLDSKPELRATLVPMLERKARVISALRGRLIGAADIPAQFEANTYRLLAPTNTASHGIVKFSGCGYGDDPSVDQAARWFAQVIEVVTPIIDSVAARHQEG